MTDTSAAATTNAVVGLARGTAEKAEAALAEAAAVTHALIPEIKGEIVPVDAADPATRAEIERRVAELDMSNTQSIITFGSTAQNRLSALSDQMLEGVRNKDVGPAGDALRSMVTTIRGFDADELDPNRKTSWWERLFSKARPVADFIAKYEGVRGQIDSITEELLDHEHVLLKDIKFLDKLYEETLAFYDEIGFYVAAGEAKLKELDTVTIPAKEQAVAAAPQEEGVMEAQELRDLRAARDELERRIHDMKLTRQVTMQQLPSIRLVQENDKGLVNKINSTLVNTIPLWRTQLATAVTIMRSKDAAGVIKEANDLTNELLTQNAKNLQVANREIREQMERGIFDIEAVKVANKTLIDTIQESLQIADEGKRRRSEAEKAMLEMERELKATLSSAKARTTGVADVVTDAKGEIRA